MTETEDLHEGGRAVVRDRLVNRLRAAGLRPRRGVTAADHASAMDHLVDHLAYLAPDVLDVLAESVLTHAAAPGPAQGQWPAEVMIRAWAEALQPRPFRQHPIVASWLRSREGPVAVAGGYLVELLRWLRRHRRPLTPGDLAQVKRDAADAQRAMARMRERVEKGVPWPTDLDALAAHARDMAEALQWVDAGAAARAAHPDTPTGDAA